MLASLVLRMMPMQMLMLMLMPTFSIFSHNNAQI